MPRAASGVAVFRATAVFPAAGILLPTALPRAPGLRAAAAFVAAAALLAAGAARAQPPELVTAIDTEFVRDGRAWRFLGVNIRGLVHYGGGDGALPYTTLEHIDENLAGASAMGCRVVRVFAANRNIPHPVAVARLGYALDKARQYGLKLIIALTDFYPTPFHPQGDDGYYTVNPWGWTVLNHAWFAGGYQDHYLPYVTLAVSTHRDHPAVFSWQLGNELADQLSADTHDAFVHALAAHIKSLDPHHLVSIGMLSLAHVPGYTEQRGAALFADPNLDFLTVHSYNGETRALDFAVRSAVLKPIIVSEAGCSAAVAGDRVAFMDARVADFVYAQGARGFMHWGYQAQAYDIGDGDNIFGFDRYAHPDYAALFALYQGHAAVLNACADPVTPPAPPPGRNVARQATAWSADTVYGPAYSGAQAYDGLLTTKWTSTAATTSHWLALDLGADRAVTGCIVRLASEGGEWSRYNWTHFVLQTGPGLAGPWTTAWDVANPLQLGRTISGWTVPAAARCIRVYVDACGIDNYARLPELEVYAVRPGDSDEDGDIDLRDAARFQVCFTGSGAAPPGPACAWAHFDPDGDVDPDDFAGFEAALAGP